MMKYENHIKNYQSNTIQIREQEMLENMLKYKEHLKYYQIEQKRAYTIQMAWMRSKDTNMH